MRAIFGEKASDEATPVAGPGMDGTVIDVRVFTRDGGKDPCSRQAGRRQAGRQGRQAANGGTGIWKRSVSDLEHQMRILEDDLYQRMERMLVGHHEGGPGACMAGDRHA